MKIMSFTTASQQTNPHWQLLPNPVSATLQLCQWGASAVFDSTAVHARPVRLLSLVYVDIATCDCCCLSCPCCCPSIPAVVPTMQYNDRNWGNNNRGGSFGGMCARPAAALIVAPSRRRASARCVMFDFFGVSCLTLACFGITPGSTDTRSNPVCCTDETCSKGCPSACASWCICMLPVGGIL